MNTTKVILIIGLIYVSLSYKDTSTRNMMLIMTGLIMICMLDLKEGLGCCARGYYTAGILYDLGSNCSYLGDCMQCREQDGCTRSQNRGDCIMDTSPESASARFGSVSGDGEGLQGYYSCSETSSGYYIYESSADDNSTGGNFVRPCSPACEQEHYESQRCIGTTDRVCSPCSPSCEQDHYESQPCLGSSDRVCLSCSPNCQAGQYKTGDCTATEDITCAECPSIDYSMAGVTVTCDGDGMNSQIADGSGNRCIEGHYYNTITDATTNTITNNCDECSTCSPGQYISRECGESTDRECAPCPTIDNSRAGVTVTCNGDGTNSQIADGSGNRCIEGYYYNDSAHACEPEYKTCLQLKTDSHTLACPQGVEKVSNHDTKIVHGVPSSGDGIQSDETNYLQFCCESNKYTCLQLHSDTESDRPPDDQKLDCTSGEFDIINSDLVSIVYDEIISTDTQRKQQLFNLACCGEADLHFSDQNECVCGENGDTPNNRGCIAGNWTNIFADGDPSIPPELQWVTADGTLSRDWSQANILCDQGIINSYCARSTDNQCSNPLPDNHVSASP